MRTRMQHFVDGFIAQCNRHQLHAELILVEWNPPPDRPPLENALQWPGDFGVARVRIVTVPREVHALFPFAAELPLLQMIGKNVGIRRAKGKYVLATNVDILFNDAIIRYMRNALRPGIMLRVDRYDVPPDLPRNTSFEQVLADCDRRFMYVNARAGTFDMKSQEMRGMSSGVPAQLLAATFEARFFGLGTGLRRVGRLASGELRRRLSTLSVNTASLPRRIASRSGKMVRSLARLFRHAAGTAVQGTVPLLRGAARIFRRPKVSGPSGHTASLLRKIASLTGKMAHPTSAARLPRLFRRAAGMAVQGTIRLPRRAIDVFQRPRVARPSVPAASLPGKIVSLFGRMARAPLAVRLPQRAAGNIVQRAARVFRGAAQFFRHGLSLKLRSRRSPRPGWRTTQTVFGLLFPGSLLARRTRSLHWLHTNACGDFTLLARDDWFRLRGYPEWPVHSWHLDSAFMYAAAAQGVREVALGARYRIFHIEHGAGWSPATAKHFFDGLALRKIPYLTNGDLLTWHDEVTAEPARAIVNDADWGLAGVPLEERQIVPA